jgi:hypothetical protein
MLAARSRSVPLSPSTRERVPSVTPLTGAVDTTFGSGGLASSDLVAALGYALGAPT